MIWDKTEHPISRWATFSVEHLVEIGNLELATLKIHLVIEDALRYLLAGSLKVQDHQVSPIHLDFSSLAELGLVAIADPHLIGAVRSLKAARNSLSHHVDSPQLHAKLSVFCQEIAYL